MSKLQITLELVSSAVPAGKTLPDTVQRRFELKDSSGAVVQTIDQAELVVSFDLPADGSYTASAETLDAVGALLGDAVSLDIALSGGALASGTPSAATGDATYQAPATLSASVQDDTIAA